MVEDQFNRPLHDLRISVIDRCNFRCSYCMPNDRKYHFMPLHSLLTFDQIYTISSIFSDLGVTKLRITGGEPLVRKELHVLIKKLSSLEKIKDIALTTNGFFLADQAQNLKDAGLQRITVSLDTMDPERFKIMSGTNHNPNTILDAIDVAVGIGLSVKINMVIKNGINETDILPLVNYCRERGIILRFIEFMDVGNINSWEMKYVLPSKDVLMLINEVYPCELVDRNYRGEVASRYRFKDGKGEFGLISSVTQSFCHSCTRARLSSNGFFYTCLFASQGHDLKTLIESSDGETAVREAIKNIWSNRTDRYSDMRSNTTNNKLASKKVEMFSIGG